VTRALIALLSAAAFASGWSCGWAPGWRAGYAAGAAGAGAAVLLFLFILGADCRCPACRRRRGPL
jgi:hypothetical protein